MRAVETGRTGRLLAPDGRYDHLPLRLVDVKAADVETLAADGRRSQIVMRLAQLVELLDLADATETTTR